MKTLILINSCAGTVASAGAEALEARLAEAAQAAGWRFTIHAGPTDELVDRARRAKTVDAIVCAGGDGTLAALARVAADREMPLLPLPCGTMNLFSRDLGFPADPVEALTAASGGHARRVDLGTLAAPGRDEQTFLNNVVFGTYAELVEAREKLRDAESVADTGAAIVQAASALINAAPDELAITLDELSIAIDTNTLVVANNCYTECIDLAPRRATLDAGVLGVYLTASGGPAAFAARLVEFLNGTLEASQKIDLYTGKQCVVERRGGGPLQFAVDGERCETIGPVEMTIMPRALRVIAPPRKRKARRSGARANASGAEPTYGDFYRLAVAAA